MFESNFIATNTYRSIILGSPMNKIQGQGQGEQFKCK